MENGFINGTILTSSGAFHNNKLLVSVRKVSDEVAVDDMFSKWLQGYSLWQNRPLVISPGFKMVFIFENVSEGTPEESSRECNEGYMRNTWRQPTWFVKRERKWLPRYYDPTRFLFSPTVPRECHSAGLSSHLHRGKPQMWEHGCVFSTSLFIHTVSITTGDLRRSVKLQEARAA